MIVTADPPRRDAVTVPLRVNIKTDDIPELLCSMTLVQHKITEDHTEGAVTVLAWISLFAQFLKTSRQNIMLLCQSILYLGTMMLWAKYKYFLLNLLTITIKGIYS